MMAMHASFSKGKNTHLILLFGAGLFFAGRFAIIELLFACATSFAAFFAQVRCDADVLREIMKECRNW